jgi:anti-sigma regulatory factor (Ser/Thr protein kinase)
MIRYFFTFPSVEGAFKISDDIFGLIIDTVDVGIAERQRLKLIMSELYTNAYLHGNGADGSRFIDVCMEIGEDEFVTIVKDEGTGMSRQRFQEMVESAADSDSTAGRGIRLVYKLSDRVRVFNDEKGKFCVKAAKKLVKGPVMADN